MKTRNINLDIPVYNKESGLNYIWEDNFEIFDETNSPEDRSSELIVEKL